MIGGKGPNVLGFGSGTSVYDSALVFGDVSIGSGAFIGPGVILDGSGGGLTIGDDTDVAAGAHIYTHDTSLRCISRRAIEIVHKPVQIGSATYVGPQCVVVPGVTIGNQCIIGANSFVNADVPDRTVVAGTPARAIARVEGEGTDIEIVSIRR